MLVVGVQEIVSTVLVVDTCTQGNRAQCACSRYTRVWCLVCLQ